MSYKIRVFMGQKIKDLLLTDINNVITIGSASTDTLTVPYADVMPSHLMFGFTNNSWVCYDNAKGETKAVSDGSTFVISMKNRIAAAVYATAQTPQHLKLTANSRVIIGRDADCMFHLSDRSVGRKHAEVFVDELGATLRDLNSLNGTYLNNTKINEHTLKDGDIISIGKYSIIYKNSALEMCLDSDNYEGRSDNPVSSEATKAKYPTFSLSPRLRHKAPSEVIEIQAPPNIGSMPMVNWLSFFPMLASRSAVSAIFPLSSIFATFLQKKKYKKAKEVRQEKYENYLADVKAKIDKNRDDQFLSLEESNHETEKCFDIATRRERTLWERCPDDDDFMKVRIGKGDINVSFKIKFPDSVLKMYNDELESEGEDLGRGNQVLEGAPILCDLYNDISVGIIGNREKAVRTARNMIVQLSTTHSYKDLKIVTLYSKAESKEWEFVKWLPHSFSDSRELRYVANDVFNAAALDKMFSEELKERKNINSGNEQNQEKKLPFYLFVIAEPELIDESEIESLLDEASTGAGIGVIYVYNELKELPRSCNIIVDIQKDCNEVFYKGDVGIKQKFSIDAFSAEKAERFARSLAPVRLDEKKSAADMPTCVTFLEGHGVKKVEELPVWDNWNKKDYTKTVAVPLGIKENGEPFIFNMMNGADFMRYHGTFGLVAGTNGSGKSEMMQSWILSLAVKFPPQYVSFIIMDYKGTGMLLPFKDLPHLAGKISNLDGNVKRNIIALNKEMVRRQRIFDEVGIVPANIEEYYKRGYHKSYKPMPRLIIVVDEFAEVKKNLPDFVPVLESIFAVGRSLGIGVIVSTQKPGGVVTDKMYANSKFRWCCRVASSADSKEMLHHTDAVKIKNAGRAYVQVGEDDIYEQVQSFWSGAPYVPDRKEKLYADIPVSMVDIMGKRIRYETEKHENKESAIKEIDAAVAYIKKIADENNVPSAPKIWQDRLDGRIHLCDIVFTPGDGFTVPYGMVDDPYNQSQYTAEINFTSDGHHLVYGAPGTGKTTFLQTCIMSVAENYAPDEVNIYGLDFGSWSLNLFSALPHVGGVANENDEEKINKLVALITDELDTRKKTFAMNGIINIKAYNQTAKEKYPYILLVVDNFSSLFSLYPGLDSFFLKLVREGASYGIYLLATTGTSGGISYKILSNIKSNIALQMKDKNEYSSVVGKTDGLEPESLEGRGLVKGNPFALEFQAALPAYGKDDNEVLENLKADISACADKNSGFKAKMIPIMPEMIPYGSVPGKEITYGLSVKDVAPMDMDIGSMPHFMVISGHHGAGASNLMKVLIKQFSEKKNAEIVLFDNDTDALSSVSRIADKYIRSAGELDNYFESLAQELKTRKNMRDSGDESFGNILIAIDGYKDMYEAIDDKTAQRISALIRMGSGLKVYLLVSEYAENMSMLCAQEPIMRNIVENGTGFLVGGSFYSHTVFRSDLKYLEANENLGEFEAYKTIGGSAVRFKIMHEF